MRKVIKEKKEMTENTKKDTLQNKIDFVVLFTVENANPNGDPLNGNRPRQTYDGFGEISDVCIKRKIRNRLQDEGYKIFVESDDRCDDGCKSLEDRANSGLILDKSNIDQSQEKACELWMDVRSFGQVFAFKAKKKANKDTKEKEKGISWNVRGPVSIHIAKSCAPVEITSMQITKSTNSSAKENDQKSSDTMGPKHFVRFGLYKIKGSINTQLAAKTGFTDEDAEAIKNALCTLFENDASAARPEGSMAVEKVYWFKHNNKSGQYPSKKVHESVVITQKDPAALPASMDDFDIKLSPLDGLEPEIINMD